jgi:hypothetical protein
VTRMSLPSFVRFFPLALLVAAIVPACSSAGSSSTPVDGGGGPAACTTASVCPDAGAPSYASEILPIFQEACIPCHSPSGTAGFDETSYAAIYSQRSPILDQVYDCLMPPTNGPQLSSAQRVALTAWLECGAPNN